MNYRVEIKEDNIIEVYDDNAPTETGAPFLRQDVHPDGRPWYDKTEAETWINNLLIEWAKPPVVQEEVPTEELPTE